MANDRPGNGPPDAFMERQIGHLLRRAYVRARENSARALEPLGDVSPVQAAALAALMAGPMSLAELGRKIGMEPANTHSLVRRLVASDLIRKSSNRDRPRRTLLTLTAAGALVAGQLETTLAGAAVKTLAPLDQSEQRLLIELLQKICW